MAKIERKTQKVFAGSASNNGQFGSAQAGTKVTSTDLDVLQNLSAFDSGWVNAVLGGENLPTLEEMQGLHYITTSQIGYVLQEGIPEYDAGTEYHQKSIVKKVGTYELYGSLIDTNTGNALPSKTDNASWQYLGDLADLKDAGSATVPDASTTEKGVVEIATDTEADDRTETGGTGATLALTPAQLANFWVYSPEVTASGNSTIDFTSIPSWVTTVEVIAKAVSPTGTTQLTLQLGDSGGIETSGYVGWSTSGTGHNTYFNVGYNVSAGQSLTVNMKLTKGFNNDWTLLSGLTNNAGNFWAMGYKTLSGTLDRVRFGVAGGTFDAGTVFVRYS